MNDNAKKALEEYRKNLTPEKKKETIEKSKKTRKKNIEKNRTLKKAVNYALNRKFKWKDEEGKIKYGDGYDAIAANMVTIAIGRKGKTADSINAAKEISKYTDEEVNLPNEITINFGNNKGLDI